MIKNTKFKLRIPNYCELTKQFLKHKILEFQVSELLIFYISEAIKSLKKLV